jgi:dihydroxyacetone kinase DhaKLM complex PTS-EIIA-like component DhaM
VTLGSAQLSVAALTELQATIDQLPAEACDVSVVEGSTNTVRDIRAVPERRAADTRQSGRQNWLVGGPRKEYGRT